MEGNVVSASKWFGFCLILSSIILVVGFNIVMDKTSKRIESGLSRAGSNARSHVSIPSHLNVSLQPGGGSFNVNLGNRDGGRFNLDQRVYEFSQNSEERSDLQNNN